MPGLAALLDDAAPSEARGPGVCCAAWLIGVRRSFGRGRFVVGDQRPAIDRMGQPRYPLAQREQSSLDLRL
jgi:hypothetical protein